MLITHRYDDQHYSTVFSPNTGFFARIEDAGAPEPLWARHGPELMDISITNWCDKGCPFCYRKSTTRGKHMTLGDYASVIEQAADMNVLQVAIGGGNPPNHPDFPEILRLTRSLGIVPSYTTNGRGLTEEVLDATKAHCGAVAVSAYEPWSELRHSLDRLRSRGIRTNIHYLLDSTTIDRAIEWLQSPPDFLDGINALVFLNFKPVTRDGTPMTLTRQAGLAKIREFYETATCGGTPFRIGFDSCMVAGLAWHAQVRSESFEACEAGRFSMFVSEDMRAFPCSFMVEGWDGVPVSSTNLRSIWTDHPLFQSVRGKLIQGRCGSCANTSSCLGGCPLFPEINLCEPYVTGERQGDVIAAEKSQVTLTISVCDAVTE